jgi:hypothetical protein
LSLLREKVTKSPQAYLGSLQNGITEEALEELLSLQVMVGQNKSEAQSTNSCKTNSRRYVCSGDTQSTVEKVMELLMHPSTGTMATISFFAGGEEQLVSEL